jgi:cell division protein FtsW (lipid II flippase)
MNLLLAVIALWASTLGLIAIDKSSRAAKARDATDAPSFAEEPGWGVLVALCIVMNIATLPYYFWATRRSAVWGIVGFGAFVGCLVVMLGVRFTLALAGVR